MKIHSTLIAALLGTVAFTARAAEPVVPGRPLAGPATPPGPSATAVEDEDLSKIPDGKLVDKASRCVKSMEEQLTDSFYMLESSLSSGDVSGAQARNEAITVMKGLVKLSEQNLIALKQRAAESDRKRVENEYVKITIACAKVGEFYAQVKSAMSLGSGALEMTQVEKRLTFSGSLPVVNALPNAFNSQYTPILTVPSEPIHASPFL